MTVWLTEPKPYLRDKLTVMKNNVIEIYELNLEERVERSKATPEQIELMRVRMRYSAKYYSLYRDAMSNCTPENEVSYLVTLSNGLVSFEPSINFDSKRFEILISNINSLKSGGA
jgi:hypothetical protein